MPVHSAREIYRFARMAGFSPDQSATMTAIALAESGGNSGAHNPRGEDSRGLWQINAAAHPDLRGVDLHDPVENARAAFRVSRGGADISPWTVTHGEGRAKYLAYRADAEAAARSAGDGTDLGVWTGTRGYGSRLAAGDGGGGAPSDAPASSADGATPSGGSATAAEEFVRSALDQAGDRYVFGAEASLDSSDPTVFDCSELTQWAAHRAGVDLPDGSWLQYRSLAEQGSTMSVEQALNTRGALLFHFSEAPTGGGRPDRAHVAISLGDGRTIEARSTRDGVGVFTADADRFNYAAVIPQFAAGGTGGDPLGPAPLGLLPAEPLDFGPAVDTDRDGLVDGRELTLRTDPTRADTDADGMSDGYELGLRTSPLQADTDRDGIGDSVELVTGSDPTSPDSDRDGRLDGSDSTADGDRDGLADDLEQVLGTDPYGMDSDGDGFTDGLEHLGAFDPTDPLVNPLAPAAVGGPGGALPSTGAAAPGPPGAGFGADGPDRTVGLDDFGVH